jgi:tubulin gamma
MIERQLEDAPELVQTPLVENMVVPPVFKGLTKELGKLAEQPLLGPRTEFPTRED